MSESQRKHLTACAYCQSELAMLEEFRSAEPTGAESADVAWIVQQLKANPLTGTSNVEVPSEMEPRSRPRGLSALARDFFRTNPFAAVAWATAAVAVMIAAGLSLQQGRRGDLSVRDDGGPLVLRSASLEIRSPRGSLAGPPDLFRWTKTDRADSYHIEVFEVDRSLVWSGHSKGTDIAVPEEVLALAVPGKTLLWRVRALSSDGAEIAASQLEKFQIAVESPAVAP